MEFVYGGFAVTAVLLLVAYLWPRSDSGNTEGRMKEADKDFSVNNPRPVLRHQQKRATAVRETVESKDRLKDALQNSDLREKHFNQGEELKDSEHGLKVSTAVVGSAVNQEAANRKLDPITYLSVEQKKEFNRLDLDKSLEEKREILRLAIISEHLTEHQKIALIQELIDLNYSQIGEISGNPKLSEGTKQRMIADREEIVTALKEDRRGRERGLLEAHNRQDVRGVNQTPKLGGGPGPPTEAEQE